MNKEFKPEDIVVLVEGFDLTNIQNILAKDKHLFEVESLWGKGRVDLKSISTGIKIGAYIEDLRHATLKEQYLRTGNSIVFEGKSYLVSEKEIIGLESGFDTDYFCDNLLTVTDKRPITKVFNRTSGKFGNKINDNPTHTTTLWERERKPKIELTSDEVIILKNIDKKYKYIARDVINIGALAIYETEPKIIDNPGNKDMYKVGDEGGDLVLLYALEHLFQDITFESGAHLIADLIKENEK